MTHNIAEHTGSAFDETAPLGRAEVTLARRLQPFAWLLAACIPLLAVAAFNGFPLVYFDTGAYLQSAAENIVPDDRPVFYGLFLKLCLLPGGSPWTPILAQVAILLFCLRALVPELPPKRFFGIAAALSVLSCLPWLAGQLLPDVFAATLVLSFVSLAEGKLTRSRRIMMSAVFMLSVLVHHSHVFIAAIALAFLAIHSLLQAHERLRACALLAALFVCCFATTLFTNRALTGEFFYSKGGHQFVMARMLQWGVMQRYLEESCPRIASPFCEYREVLSTEVGKDYLWDSRSPLAALGGWSARRTETITAILGAATTFPASTVAHAGVDALRQLGRVKTGEGSYSYDSSTKVVEQLRKRFPTDFAAFSASAQQRGTLRPLARTISRLHLAAMVAALGILLLSARARNFRLFAVLGLIVINAVVCGVLSTPDNRYGSRVAWIPVFLAMAQLAAMRRQQEVETVRSFI